MYNEEMLRKERKKLYNTEAFTIIEYIKTSIEILMNMKSEESELYQDKLKHKKQKDMLESQSAKSLDEPPKDYEQML